MRVLALDTSTSRLSAALARDGQTVCEINIEVKTGHAGILLAVIDELLGRTSTPRNGLDLIAVGVGPGSFTGLRIGIATAKGLALAAGKPLVGVSSLEALACNPARPGVTICPMIDARRNQVYAALFGADDRGNLQRIRPDELADLACCLRGLVGEVVFVGSGAARYAGDIRRLLSPAAVFASDHHHLIRASAVGRLGLRNYRQQGAVEPVRFMPRYLRTSDAEGKMARRADDVRTPDKCTGKRDPEC